MGILVKTSFTGSPVGAHSPLFGGILNTSGFEFLFSGKVLEIGVGHERLYANSITVDINPEVKADYHFDARNLPFADKEFDLVVAHEVLCTMKREDQLAVLKEMKRVGRAVYVRAWKLCAWRLLANCGLKVSQEEFETL